MNTAKLIYDIWVDGGNTEGLLHDVKYAYPWDTYELYADLISKSPYLSDSVLLATIYQTNVLPDIMVKYILIANPQSLRNEFLLGLVYENRMDMFPGGIAEVSSYITDTISPREALEAQISYYTQERQSRVNQLKVLCITDTTGVYGMDSLKAILANDIEPESGYQLASIYLNNGDYETYSNIMDNIPYKYEYGKNEMQRHQDYIDYFSIEAYLITNNMDYSQLSTDQINKLYDLANRDNDVNYTNASTFTTAYARTLLRLTDANFVYHEPIFSEENTPKSMIKIKKPTEKKEENLLKVYPNPAKDYFIIDYKLNNESAENKLELYDGLGRKLKTFIINDKYGQLNLTTQSLKKGVYYIVLLNNVKMFNSCKVIIN